jgi:hypothetical protein
MRVQVATFASAASSTASAVNFAMGYSFAHR